MTIRTTMLAASLFAFAFAAACSNSDDGGNTDPAQNDDGNTATTREALNFVAPCTTSACGEVPSSSKSTKPTCAQLSGSCSWSDADPSGTVSYRPCAESECGTKPDASVCPSGTTFKGAQCGSENEGACTWTSACVPPPSTTPCPEADGCGPQPAIGVICSDGGSGGLECMKQGSKCVWQRTCE